MAVFSQGVIFEGVDTSDPNCWTLDAYVKRGGYEALKRILQQGISQDDVIAEVKLLPDAASLEITADEPEPGAEVAGRFQDLRRALLNLAENGVKYVSSVRESGGRVDVAVADGGSQWCITVDDNGPGIPDADRVKIFERFTRGDGHRARGKAATGGYGLGLAISRRTAERLGGSLELGESELGGAAFVMKLPKA